MSIFIKKSFVFTTRIDKSIKVGDTVQFHDGSGLSCDQQSECGIQALFIVGEYTELTGSTEIIKEMKGEVVEVGIKDRVCINDGFGYLQDIVVKLGNGLFRTPSEFVHKVD